MPRPFAANHPQQTTVNVGSRVYGSRRPRRVQTLSELPSENLPAPVGGVAEADAAQLQGRSVRRLRHRGRRSLPQKKFAPARRVGGIGRADASAEGGGNRDRAVEKTGALPL